MQNGSFRTKLVAVALDPSKPDDLYQTVPDQVRPQIPTIWVLPSRHTAHYMHYLITSKSNNTTFTQIHNRLVAGFHGKALHIREKCRKTLFLSRRQD